MRTKKFGEVDPVTGRKWGGSPLTHWRNLKRMVARGSVDIPCGDCTACCRSGAPIYEDDGSEIPKRPDGACIHLADHGCARHATRPEQCRMYACTMLSIAAVVTDNPVMNAALSRWQWDLSGAADKAFAEAAREKEAQITLRENLADAE